MSYQPFPIVEVALDLLQLDLANYRIPTRREDQADALNYLFASEDVLGAAKLILRNGYLDNEVPIVIETDGAYVVLEGNRRVSALKALRSPDLAPSHAAEVRGLLKRYAEEAEALPNTIRVMVMPDRDTAAPHVARLHTGLSKRRWTYDQQATYYYSLLSDQTTVQDVKSRYPGVNVVRFIRMAEIRRFLSGVHFADTSLHKYVIGDELPMSSFEYAYLRPGIAAAIGVSFDPDGRLLPHGSSPNKIGAALSAEHVAALEYLAIEFRAGKLNTRSPELKTGRKEHDRLVDRLNGTASSELPPDQAGPAEDAENEDPEATVPSSSDPSAVGAPAPPAPAPGVRGPNSADSKNTLDLSGIDYDNAPANLKRRYVELRSLNITTYPYATAMLLRSILETTIKVHFENTNTPADGMLKPSVEILKAAYGTEKPIASMINKIQSGNEDKPRSTVGPVM